MTNLQQEFAKVREHYKNDPPPRFVARTALRAIIWDKTGGKCWYCGGEMNPFRNFNVDHLVPIISGGDESFNNLVPCCRKCNRSKGAHTVEIFRDACARRKAGYPGFTEEQIVYLQSSGVRLPELLSAADFRFYFEEANL